MSKVNYCWCREENQIAMANLMKAVQIRGSVFECYFEIEGHEPIYIRQENAKYMTHNKFNEVYKAISDLKVLKSRFYVNHDKLYLD